MPPLYFFFLAPLLAFFVLLLWGKQLKPFWVSAIALSVMGLCMVVALFLLQKNFHTHTHIYTATQYDHFTWFHVGKFRLSATITLDLISLSLLAVTSLVSFFVHIYAVGYMKGEKNYHRFFAFLSLFTVSMYGLLLTDNLLVIYIFWELVGLCSYLLISFWHEKEAAIQAAKKAFLINRFGDIGFFVAIALLWQQFNTLSISEISALLSPASQPLLFWAGLGFCVAAAAKSAQLPFSMWLPDAMEAPTPVSALLHAATMVAAGVYLLIRVEFLLPANLHILLMIIGAISAFTAALTACFQTEMKKTLAFSTISQLGLMFIAIGLSVPELAFFHLLTHAFFKANLFLGVGYFSRLKANTAIANNFQIAKYIVFIAYCISAASLIGVPFTSGFLSKELILYSLELQATANNTLFLTIVLDIILALFLLTSFCSAYYMARQVINIYKTHIQIPKPLHTITQEIQQFNNKPIYMKQFSGDTIAIVFLAIFSLFFPFSVSPFQADFFIQNAEITYTFDMTIFVVAMFALLLGVFSAWLMSHYRHQPHAQQYSFFNYLNLTYNTLLLQFTLTALRFTSSAAFHENYFARMSLFFKNIAIQLAKTDSKAIDSGLHFSVLSSVGGGHILAWFDKNIADGFIRLTVWITAKMATQVRNLQNGKIQLYLLLFLVGVMGLAICWIMM
jgi:NADH-quinone oxidoreductase subunit L